MPKFDRAMSLALGVWAVFGLGPVLYREVPWACIFGSQTASGWVQAFGSIAAIVGAFMVANRQAVVAKRLAAEQVAERVLGLHCILTFAETAARAWLEEWSKGEAAKPDILRKNRRDVHGVVLGLNAISLDQYLNPIVTRALLIGRECTEELHHRIGSAGKDSSLDAAELPQILRAKADSLRSLCEGLVAESNRIRDARPSG